MKQLLFLIIFTTPSIAKSQTADQLNKQRITLPNGWSLTPVGKSLPLGDLPLNIATSKSGKYIAVTNNGQSTQSIQLFDAKKEIELDNIKIPKAWYGLKFTADEKRLYASGGNDNWILQYSIINQKLICTDTFKLLPKKKELISPSGIEINEQTNILYVVTKENNTLYEINLTTKEIITQIKIAGEAYSCLLSADKNILYISCWGADKIFCYDTKSKKIETEIAVGDNPNEIILDKAGEFLFVANANDNSVSVISTSENKVIETLNAALYPNAPSGSTTNGLALSTDEKTLYIANADNNCLAVFDVSVKGKSFSKGLVFLRRKPIGDRFGHHQLHWLGYQR